MEKARSNRYMSDLETSKISLQSKFDQTSKISKSVFISNFPDDCTNRDLWNVCNDYDTVVDVFIPNKKSKAGKRFAFVRFIKVLNFDRLIENLKTIWIGRFHLSANPARFDRPKALTFQKDNPVSSGNVTRFRQPNVQYHGGSNVTISTPPFLLKPTLVLDDSCLVNRDLVNCVMERIVWVDIEGVPLNAWSRSTFQKIASKWGEMVELEDGRSIGTRCWDTLVTVCFGISPAKDLVAYVLRKNTL
nr:hypothetical protein [Tanacetum cinerariifolium]